ncbi:MAG: hypothetical protein JW969_01660 [Spirochaetales bacterium]|nr:hypothetical protein [Spirochaetales bacterium]
MKLNINGVFTQTILFILFCACAFNLYANGSKESLSKDAWFYLDKDKLIDIPVQLEWSQGQSRAVFNRSNKSHAFSYMVYKEDGVYKNYLGSPIIDRADIAYLDYLFANTRKNDQIIADQDPLKSMVSFIGVAKSSISIPDNIVAVLNSIRISGDTVKMGWVKYDQEKHLDCLLFEAKYGGYNYMRIEIRFMTEFFGGERDLFAAVDKYLELHYRPETYNYVQKALGFLGTLFKDEIRADTSLDPSPYLKIVKEYLEFYLKDVVDIAEVWQEAFGGEKDDEYCLINLFGSPGFWQMFRSTHDAYSDKNLAFFQNELKKSLLLHFKSKEEDNRPDIKLPYMDLGQDTLDAIYGNQRNIYTMVYLDYCYTVNKPVLSLLIQQKLSGYCSYDYRQYESIKDDFDSSSINTDGERIAEMAMRYLTWGVEYTPYTAQNTISISSTGNPVYDINYDRFIKDWITVKGNRNSNYIKAGVNYGTPEESTGIHDPSVPKQVHYLNIGDKTESFYLIGRVKESNVSKQIRLARIDLWNAENIAWQPGRITEILLQNSTGQFSEVQKQWIFDKRIQKGSGAPNLHIIRNNPDTPIGINVRFGKPETVGGILLVRGYVDNYWATKDDLNKGLFEIEYTISDGTTGVLKSSDFNEYVTDPRTPGRFIHYGMNDSGTVINGIAGTGTASPYYSQDNSMVINEHAAYSYFIPKTEILNCIRINLKDCTKAQFFNVSELCVFDGNPLPFGRNYDRNIGLISSTTKHAALFSNGNFGFGYDISEGKDVNLYNIILSANMRVKNLVVWEESADPTKDSTYLNQEFQVISSQFVADPNFTAEIDYGSIEKACNKLSDERLLTTPFVDADNEFSLGNPLPFSLWGIDCPRTFAYKMSEQINARDHYKGKILAAIPDYPEENLRKKASIRNLFARVNTTRALDGYNIENYNSCYINELDIFKVDKNISLSIDPGNYRYRGAGYPNAILGVPASKPYLPGLVPANPEKYKNEIDSLYCPDKIAGVDSLGLLIGSLSMAGFDNIVNALNQPTTKILDGFYQMDSDIDQIDTVPLKGLRNGKPTYYPQGNNSFLNTPYRFKNSDLERNTILVPDIHFIQKGDLLVKFGPTGESPHIGIVIGFLWDEQPAFGSDIRDYWNKVIVLSIREGFQHVTLGTWGSNPNMFGGFSVTPESYHIRRLVKLKQNGSTGISGAVDPFEVVREVDKIGVNVALPDAGSSIWKRNHWIPLSGDKHLGGIEINLTAYDSDNKEIELRDANNEVVPLPPRDFGFLYEDMGVGKSNLLTNHGCGVSLYADVDGADDILLCTFERTTAPEKLLYLSSIQVEGYVSPYIPYETYVQALVPISDQYYIIKQYTPAYSNGRLFVRDKKLIFRSENGTEYDKFSVGTDGTGLSGDDYLLRFGLKSDPAVTCVAPEEQFLSVMPNDFVMKELESSFKSMLQGLQNIGQISASDYENFEQVWNDDDEIGDKTDLWLYGARLLFHDKISGRILGSSGIENYMDQFDDVYNASGLDSFLDPANEKVTLDDKQFDEKGEDFDKFGNEEYNRPKGQLHPYYIGTSAHDRIGQYYEEKHYGEEVYLNYYPLSGILKRILSGDFTNPKNIITDVLNLKPDITNLSKHPRHIYEIKPVKYAINGIGQLWLYMLILNSELIHPDYNTARDEFFIPGPVGDPGTIGVVSAAGGYVVFASVLPGLILYEWIRTEKGVPLTKAVALEKFREFLEKLKKYNKFVPVYALLVSDATFILNTLNTISELNSIYMGTDFATPYLIGQLQVSGVMTAGVLLATAAVYFTPAVLAYGWALPPLLQKAFEF